MNSQRKTICNIALAACLASLLGGCSFTRDLFSDAGGESVKSGEVAESRFAAESTANTGNLDSAAADIQVISPEIDRRDIVVPKIDTEDFEVGIYAGILSIENFGSEPVTGLRAAYHVTEDFFFELSYGVSEVSDTNFRRFGISLFPEETQDVTYYDAALGYKILPGEVFILNRWAFTSDMYIKLGAGNTQMVDEDFLTYNLGFGLRVLPTDWLSLRFEAVDHFFETDLLGDSEFTNNFEFNFGIAFFF